MRTSSTSEPQGDLSGHVAADSTVFRTFHEITPTTSASIAAAGADLRSRVWRRSAVTAGTQPLYLDIDASLVQIHSEKKEETGPNRKDGFGFHPLLSLPTAPEALAGRLHPGDAGSNTVADHVVVLDDAPAQLPAAVAVGYRVGDDSSVARS
ncbi:MAG: transposase [Actinomycetota bacterium]|nr:transposase [Actinomycetota bacterium]